MITDWEAERARILTEVKKRLDELFPHKLFWPTCYRDGDEMVEVSEMGKNIFFRCFKCGHEEMSI